MTTKTVLIEVEVPEGETVIEVVCESTEHGKWMRQFRVVPPAPVLPDEILQTLAMFDPSTPAWIEARRRAAAILNAAPADGDQPIDWKRRAEIAEAKLLRLKASGIRPPVGFGDFVPVDALLAAAPAEGK